MQDEVIKHSRKIRKIMKKKEKSFSYRIREIAIEILIIVVAVSLSIWLHNWSEHHKQQKEVKEFLIDCKEDLNNDIEGMIKQKERLVSLAKQYYWLDSLAKASKIDLDKKIDLSIPLGIYYTNVNDANYEGFKSSGKIGLIENKDIKKNILKYYQEKRPSVNQQILFLNNQMLKLSEMVVRMNFHSSGTSKLNAKLVIQETLTPEVQQMLILSAKIADAVVEEYDRDIDYARKLIIEIDKEIKE